MRIASLQPSVTLTLAALDRLDALCAITKYCIEAMPELASRNLAVLHDSWSANTEEIQAARPDLVIASVPYRMESLASILKASMPVVAFAPHGLADIYSDIRILASLVHADPKPLIHHMQQTIATIQARTAHLAREQKPLVYCEEWGKPLIHSQRWVAELVEAAGGRFLGTPGTHTTAEEIAAADPDIMIFAWCGAGNRVPLNRVITQRKWQALRAVRTSCVRCIQDEHLNTPAPTLLKGLASIAAIIHPTLSDPAILA